MSPDDYKDLLDFLSLIDINQLKKSLDKNCILTKDALFRYIPELHEPIGKSKVKKVPLLIRANLSKCLLAFPTNMEFIKGAYWRYCYFFCSICKKPEVISGYSFPKHIKLNKFIYDTMVVIYK